jgi:hypothetical protein
VVRLDEVDDNEDAFTGVQRLNMKKDINEFRAMMMKRKNYK